METVGIVIAVIVIGGIVLSVLGRGASILGSAWSH